MENVSRPVIGILGVPTYDNEKFLVTAVYEDYRKAIVKNNCIPFMISPVNDINYYDTKLSDIPPLAEKEMNFYKEMVDMCDGLLLPGGYRIYNFYEFIVNYAIEKDIPILGTCLGMQLLAMIDNNHNCLEENKTDNHKKRGIDYAHTVQISKDTLLNKIVDKDEIKVNSLHRYHVTGVKDFLISAYSDDGLIEAIELPSKRFVLVVQWHPEKMISYDSDANKIINKFVFECTKVKHKKLEQTKVNI